MPAPPTDLPPPPAAHGLGHSYRRLQTLPAVGGLLRRLEYPVRRLVRYHLSPSTRREWAPRIQDALDCPDNAHIPRHPRSGRLEDGCIVMHNGLRVAADSYFGEPMRLLLERNHGVHEPQEERAFQEVLAALPAGAAMVELGAYWGFYSLWFHQRVEGARNVLVEPNPAFLRFGQRNFALNGFPATFVHGLVGAASGRADDGTPVVCVDDLRRDLGLERIHVLHSDIQGAEMEMLAGARRCLEERRIDFVFLSTHGDDLHGACRRALQEHGFEVLADADLRETYSIDGVLVARRAELPGPGPIPISRRPPRGGGGR